MQICINDIEKEVTDGISVAELIAQLKLSGPVAVEINRKLCPKKQHSETILKENDVLEIVTIVGGG